MAFHHKESNEDYIYRLQIDETAHQNHRLTWILAAQALLFTCLGAMVGDSCKWGIIPLTIILAVCISISGIYSVLVSELTIGTLFERHALNGKLFNNRNIPHMIMAAPAKVLKTKLTFLQFFKFAPNAFCSAWITLLLAYCVQGTPLAKFLVASLCCSKSAILIATYCIILITVLIMTSFIAKFLRYKWVNDFVHDSPSTAEHHTGIGYTEGNESGNMFCQTGKANKQINIFNGDSYWRSFNNKCPNGVPPTGPSRSTYPIGCSQLRIYHIMIDCFFGFNPKNVSSVDRTQPRAFLGGTINGIREKLDYIHRQGFNAIMLTPFFATENYHGYHITSYEEIEKSFGTWQDVMDLINEVHAKGMKIICDFVPNHCHRNNPIFKALWKRCDILKGWFYFDENNDYATYHGLKELPKINLFNSAATEYMYNVAVDLIAKGVDGLRIDHAIGVPFHFLQELRRRCKCINPDCFLIGEVCLDEKKYAAQFEFKTQTRRTEFMQGKVTQEDLQKDYIGVLDGVLDFRFRDIMIEAIISGKPLADNKSLQNALREHFAQYPPDFKLFLFLDNHDLDRIRFICQDKERVEEAINYMETWGYDFCFYYGTERGMANKVSIKGRDHGDLDVRIQMEF